jgi:hypothetical protein
MWESMSAEGHVALKSRLLDALERETERSIRRNVCDTVSDLAIGTLSSEQPWPEMYMKLDEWVKGPNFELREAALYVFELMSHFFATVRGLTGCCCWYCKQCCLAEMCVIHCTHCCCVVLQREGEKIPYFANLLCQCMSDKSCPLKVTCYLSCCAHSASPRLQLATR